MEDEEQHHEDIEVEDEKKSEEIPEEISIEPDENEKKDNNNNQLNSNHNSNQEATSNNQKSSEKIEQPKSPKSNKKQNSNTKKKNIPQKKQPFIISENQTEPYKKVKITINACSFFDEYMMPIWCPKNIYIKFRVEGKWRIDKKYEYTDSRGLRSNNSKGFNYGSLIGRIGKKSNEELKEKDKEKEKKRFSSLIHQNNFVVANEVTFLVKEEGPLYLRPNLPKNMKIEPEGKLEVSVYDGDYMDISEINEKIGWQENGTIIVGKSEKSKEQSPNKNKGTKKELNEKDLEKNLIKNINNLRMNPSMYFEKYISFNTNYLWTKEYLYELKKEFRDPLQVEESSYKFLVDFTKSTNQQQLKKNINKNNISEYLAKMSEDLSYYIKDLFSTSKIVNAKCKLTQKVNPIDIIVQYLLDKQYRRNIFNTYSKEIAAKIVKNFYNDSTLVIIVIILDRDNPIAEES